VSAIAPADVRARNARDWRAARRAPHAAAAGAARHSPLIVSYMCQRQSSLVRLPSAALMPPCAATVCERVGKSFVMQAVLKPFSARPMAARRPAPPAPTTTAS